MSGERFAVHESCLRQYPFALLREFGIQFVDVMSDYEMRVLRTIDLSKIKEGAGPVVAHRPACQSVMKNKQLRKEASHMKQRVVK